VPALSELASWRWRQRRRLLARRAALSARARRAASQRIGRALAAAFPALGARGAVVGFCWPYRGEPDVRPAVRRFLAGGARAALPVVRGRGAPLTFRRWAPGAPLKPGALGIPVPARGGAVRPTALLIPMIGYDAAGHRLGFGAGYFDRTLAALTPRPLAIGIALEESRLRTIRPRRRDVPMDFVVTERAVRARVGTSLRPVDPAGAAARARALAARRRRAARS